MAKTKTTFFCQNCGAQYAKWQGQCNSCKEWNTIAEEIVQKADAKDWKSSSARLLSGVEANRSAKPQRISEISTQAEARLNTKNNELNRVLGGGLVPGSLTLLGGEPGIGRSEEHTSELQSRENLVCRLLLEKKNMYSSQL